VQGQAVARDGTRQRRNDQRVHCTHLAQHTVEAVDQGACHLRRLIQIAAKQLQVGASHEGTLGADDHDGANRRIPLCNMKRLTNIGDHLAIDCIHPVRAVELEDCDGAILAAQYRLVVRLRYGHGRSLNLFAALADLTRMTMISKNELNSTSRWERAKHDDAAVRPVV
jgi:hypothetical protein